MNLWCFDRIYRMDKMSLSANLANHVHLVQ